MFEKSLKAITEEDLRALVENKASEGRTLDFKRDLNLTTEEHKRELARDISSFANAAGGLLIYGVEEAKGLAEAVVGVACENFDKTAQQLEQVATDLIDPRVHGLEVRAVGGFDRGPVILVRVPRSWIGPHMVSYQKQTHFYSRNTCGKRPLDVREIRVAFLAGSEVSARIRRFKEGRIGRVVAGETPVMLRGGETYLVVHVLPGAACSGPG